MAAQGGGHAYKLLAADGAPTAGASTLRLELVLPLKIVRLSVKPKWVLLMGGVLKKRTRL